MSGAPAFEDGAPVPDESSEIPIAVAENIASWRRVISKAPAENHPQILLNAAADLFRTREINRTFYPRTDAIVCQTVADALADLAESVGIPPDDAQMIFVRAQRDESPEHLNGLVAADVPPPASPENYGTDPTPAEPVAQAAFITPAAWPDEAPPPVDWLAAGRIPRGDVTSLHGDGGAGKTDIALRLAANCARGAPDWLGHQIANGAVVFISAEEPQREIRRRAWLHAERDGYHVAELTNLHFWFPAESGDGIMAVPDRSGIMRATPLFRSIEAAIRDTGPVLVIGDNVAATFAGNQNDRVMVRSYVNLWRAIARGPSEPAVLLLDHPSLSGLTNNTGRGGNMDWRNAVRCALYLHPAEDKAEADCGIRILETVKSNYGPTGNPLRLQWADGGLALEHAPSSLHRLAKDAKCDETFLRLLDERNAQGRYVSDKKSRNYAPTVFAEMTGDSGFTAKAFARAMDRLFEARKIALRVERIDGKPRKVIDRASEIAAARVGE